MLEGISPEDSFTRQGPLRFFTGNSFAAVRWIWYEGCPSPLPRPMTHRRLYLYLLVSGTLLLGVVWWMSFRTWTTLSVSAPPFTGAVHVGSATVSVAWNPNESSPYPPRLRTIPVRRTPKNLAAAMGKWNVRTGNIYQVAFPVWVPYALLAVAGLAIVRRAESRPRGGMEKKMAERHAAGGAP